MAQLNLDEAYMQYAREVYQFLLRLCGDEDLAEDIFYQECLAAR